MILLVSLHPFLLSGYRVRVNAIGEEIEYYLREKLGD
jgi:hypothetical protein